MFSRPEKDFLKKSLLFPSPGAIIFKHIEAHAPVAQLDRVTDYESVGRGFESLLAYHKHKIRTSSSAWERGSDFVFSLSMNGETQLRALGHKCFVSPLEVGQLPHFQRF